MEIQRSIFWGDDDVFVVVYFWLFWEMGLKGEGVVGVGFDINDVVEGSYKKLYGGVLGWCVSPCLLKGIK